MAGQIYGFNQVFDSNGDPLPGAKLITRVPGTTTPKATYNAPDLLNPLTNPVIADSAGRFPQMWANTGENFDLVLTDENDVTIEAFESVTALGTEDQEINIDFGSNGRFAVRGADGVPNIEFGDVTGDNVGGSGRIGGWDGTQGDNLEVDFATTTFTGALNVAGPISTPSPSGLAVPMVVGRGTVSAVSTIDIPIPATYSSYMLEIRNMVGSVTTAQQLNGTLSFDGGGTYKSAADDYQVALFYNGGSTTSQAATNSASVGVTRGSGGASGLGGTDVRVQIWTGSTRETRMLSDMCGFTAGNNLLSVMGQVASTTNNKGYGRATNLRIVPSTGTVSFSWVLTGIP